MVKLRLLQYLFDITKPNDSYDIIEFRIRLFMNGLACDGTIRDFDVKSDPSGPEYAIWWIDMSSPKKVEKIKIDPKNIDRDMLVILEVLSS